MRADGVTKIFALLFRTAHSRAVVLHAVKDRFNQKIMEL